MAIHCGQGGEIVSASIQLALALAIQDTAISPNANPLPAVGTWVSAPNGTQASDIVLAAASSNVAIPFPIGVTTAAVLVIVAENIADLIVKIGGVAMPVLPAGQPLILYGYTASALSLSSVLGGHVTILVGG